VTRWSTEGSSGETPTTSVQRLIFELVRPKGVVDQIFLPCAIGTRRRQADGHWRL
jgi:hypothetical protein